MIGGCVFAARVELSADNAPPSPYYGASGPFPGQCQSTGFESHHQRMWSLLLDPFRAGSGAATSPLAAPRTTTGDLVQSPCRERPPPVRQLPAEVWRNYPADAAIWYRKFHFDYDVFSQSYR